MNPEITIVETRPEHIRMMAESMHERTSSTALRIGVSPRKALWRSYKQSIICRTAFINGKIAAVWGLAGTLMGETGYPWLVMAPVADDYPFKVAFIYRQELKRMQGMFPVLEDFVDETHDKAIRLLELMGFTIGTERIQAGEVVLRRAERVA